MEKYGSVVLSNVFEFILHLDQILALHFWQEYHRIHGALFSVHCVGRRFVLLQ